MAKFNSSAIKVFPSTNRFEYPQGKLTSEENFVNIINSITDYKSYVLEYPRGTGTLKVILGGYYFEIENFTPRANVWLRIIVEKTNYGQLVSQSDTSDKLDDGNSFQGLQYFDAKPTNADIPDRYRQNITNYDVIDLNVTDGNGEYTNVWRLKTDSVKYVSTSTNSDRKLTDDLDRRQYRIEAGAGLRGFASTSDPTSVTNNYSSNNVIAIADKEMKKLNSLGSKGNNYKFIYFNDSGEATVSTGTRGGNVKDVPSTSTPVKQTTDIILRNGEFIEGRTVFFSTGLPVTSVNAKVGDIWLRYQ